MKVLHVVINGEIAGGQVVCLRIIEALFASGHQTAVVSPSDGPFIERLRKRGVPVFFLSFKKSYSFHCAFQLARLIKREKVNLVHTHGMVPLNIHSRIAAHLAGVPCISHIHIANVFNVNPIIRQYQMNLDNWSSNFCYKLIAVSNSTKESLVKQGIPAHRIEVVPNGIDVERIKGVRSRREVLGQLGVESRKRLVGVIGRLCPAKGQEEFLKAIQGLRGRTPDTLWVIVGKDMEFSGGYERKLRMMARDFGLNGQVIFTGYQEDPLSLLNAMDFLVAPSRAEGMPLVILEAMALQKAVIATSVGGIPEVVQNEKTGLLTPEGDAKTLTQAILKLLENPGLARAMGERGYEVVKQNFSASAGVLKIMNLYQEAKSPSL